MFPDGISDEIWLVMVESMRYILQVKIGDCFNVLGNILDVIVCLVIGLNC